MKNSVKLIYYIIITLLIFATVLLIAFCEGHTDLFFFDDKYSYKTFTMEKKKQNHTVFICGAVKKSGYYTFEFGETYYQVLSRAGLLDVSYVGNGDSLVSVEVSEILCNFYEDGQIVYPVNVNSDLFAVLYPTANIAKDIADKIINFISLNGKLNAKEDLLQVLTQQEWDDVFFRIYVGDRS